MPLLVAHKPFTTSFGSGCAHRGLAICTLELRVACVPKSFKAYDPRNDWFSRSLTAKLDTGYTNEFAISANDYMKVCKFTTPMYGLPMAERVEAFGGTKLTPHLLRTCNLWIFLWGPMSQIQSPVQVPLSYGAEVFRIAQRKPVIGMLALIAAKAKLELDFALKEFNVTVP